MTDPGPAFTAMNEVVANAPITAELALEPISGGTRVIMQCEYTGPVGTRRQYKLVVVPKSGSEAEVGDWTAGHGDKFEITAQTQVPQSDIDRVEIRSAATGAVLMTYRP
jgi:hypothetical protein